MRKRFVSLGAAALCAVTMAASADEPTAVGFWVTKDHGAVVQVEACDSGLCGHLVGLRTDRDPNEIALDTENADPTSGRIPAVD